MITPVKNGFHKRVRDTSDFDVDQCPFCKIDLVLSEQLGYHDDLGDCERWARSHHSMETTVSSCPQCRKWFVFWESLDYDFFNLVEIEPDKVFILI